MPCAARLLRVLFLEWGEFDGCGGVIGGVEGFEDALSFGVAEGELGGPLAVSGVQDICFPLPWVYHSGKACLFALASPSAAGIVDASAEA